MFFLKRFAQVSALAITVIMLCHCGQQGNNSSTCTANVVDNMTLAVTRIGGTTYRFTLCQNMNNPAPYTVYSGSSSGLMSAKQQVSDAFAANDTFQVTFFSTDTVFAIYYDADPARTLPLVSPHSIPQN